MSDRKNHAFISRKMIQIQTTIDKLKQTCRRSFPITVFVDPTLKGARGKIIYVLEMNIIL